MHWFIFILLTLTGLLSQGGCTNPHALSRFEFTRIEMGVATRIVVYSPDFDRAVAGAIAAFDRIAVLDAVLSDYRPDSEAMRLCDAAGAEPVAVSHDLYHVTAAALDFARESDGLYDPTLGPLITLWREARRATPPTLPTPDQLAAARARCGWQHVHLWEHDGQHFIRLAVPNPPGMRLDYGGIGKGYAAQAAVNVLRAPPHGLTRCMVSLAGDIVVGDPPPGEDGWKIEVSFANGVSPPGPGTLLLSCAAVSTSGDAEQFIEINGTRYSHIIDPRTGLGATSRYAATVIAHPPSRGELADALCKPLALTGPTPATANLIRTHPATAAIIAHLPDTPTTPAEFRVIDPRGLLKWAAPSPPHSDPHPAPNSHSREAAPASSPAHECRVTRHASILSPSGATHTHRPQQRRDARAETGHSSPGINELSSTYPPPGGGRKSSPFRKHIMLRAVFGSRMLWVGVAMLVLGTGPLLITIALDPKANPVGFGMLTFFTFWPSILLIVVGLIAGVVRGVRLRNSQQPN